MTNSFEELYGEQSAGYKATNFERSQAAAILAKQQEIEDLKAQLASPERNVVEQRPAVPPAIPARLPLDDSELDNMMSYDQVIGIVQAATGRVLSGDQQPAAPSRRSAEEIEADLAAATTPDEAIAAVLGGRR
ncbi:hypothetical protein [Jiangella endophytica]|uniref:hypothetical protein n=1 Tax=Jiangella endophytica TaxID=1623398 RepID=UPI000E357B0E|nr:hypothetical protein [Jiangella endophytica]